MGIIAQLASKRESNWLEANLSVQEAKTIIDLAKIAATIQLKRIDMGMTQHEFAEYMGVSQSMVNKWESGTYNFTIRTLNELCERLKLKLSFKISEKYISGLSKTSWTQEKMKNVNYRDVQFDNMERFSLVA